MKNEIIAENYKRFFGEELNEADQVSKQGQDMDGGPIRQNDPAAEPVGSFKPDEGAKDEQSPEDKGNDETKGKDTEDLKNQIFDLLKEGETPESIIVKFFGKDDKGEDEVKKALDDLKNEGKIQDRTIWSIVATDEDEEKTGVGKDSTKDETDLAKEEEQEETEQPAPEMQQQAGAAPAPTTPAAGPMGGQPPAMMKNYKKNDEEDNFASDEDEDFKDDEFDDFNDDEEDEKKHETSDHPTPEMDDSDEDEDGKVIDDVIDDVDDLKVLLKSIEPRLRRLREKSASAKKAVR